MKPYQFRRYISVQCGGLDVSALRISFDITNHADENPPEGQVDIYNLSRRHHAQVQERGVDIFVNAGYTGGAGVFRLFAGTVKRVIKTRVDHAFITRIFIENAIVSVSNQVANISEDDPALSVRDIARKLVVDQMGMRVNNLEVIPANAVYPNFNTSGDPKRALGTLLSGTPGVNGQRIKIIDDEGTIHFMAGLKPITQHEVVVKTPDNGLVGVPQEQEEGRAAFTMLLEPRLRVGGAFEVQKSRYIPDGRYTIMKLQHVGDNWTGKFVSNIECAKEGTQDTKPVAGGTPAGDTSDSGFASNTLSGREQQSTTPVNIRN